MRFTLYIYVTVDVGFCSRLRCYDFTLRCYGYVVAALFDSLLICWLLLVVATVTLPHLPRSPHRLIYGYTFTLDTGYVTFTTVWLRWFPRFGYVWFGCYVGCRLRYGLPVVPHVYPVTHGCYPITTYHTSRLRLRLLRLRLLRSIWLVYGCLRLLVPTFTHVCLLHFTFTYTHGYTRVYVCVGWLRSLQFTTFTFCVATHTFPTFTFVTLRLIYVDYLYVVTHVVDLLLLLLPHVVVTFYVTLVVGWFPFVGWLCDLLRCRSTTFTRLVVTIWFTLHIYVPVGALILLLRCCLVVVPRYVTFRCCCCCCDLRCGCYVCYVYTRLIGVTSTTLLPFTLLLLVTLVVTVVVDLVVYGYVCYVYVRTHLRSHGWFTTFYVYVGYVYVIRSRLRLRWRCCYARFTLLLLRYVVAERYVWLFIPFTYVTLRFVTLTDVVYVTRCCYVTFVTILVCYTHVYATPFILPHVCLPRCCRSDLITFDFVEHVTFTLRCYVTRLPTHICLHVYVDLVVDLRWLHLRFVVTLLVVVEPFTLGVDYVVVVVVGWLRLVTLLFGCYVYVALFDLRCWLRLRWFDLPLRFTLRSRLRLRVVVVDVVTVILLIYVDLRCPVDLLLLRSHCWVVDTFVTLIALRCSAALRWFVTISPFTLFTVVVTLFVPLRVTVVVCLLPFGRCTIYHVYVVVPTTLRCLRCCCVVTHIRLRYVYIWFTVTLFVVTLRLRLFVPTRLLFPLQLIWFVVVLPVHLRLRWLRYVTLITDVTGCYAHSRCYVATVDCSRLLLRTPRLRSRYVRLRIWTLRLLILLLVVTLRWFVTPFVVGFVGALRLPFYVGWFYVYVVTLIYVCCYSRYVGYVVVAALLRWLGALRFVRYVTTFICRLQLLLRLRFTGLIYGYVYAPFTFVTLRLLRLICVYVTLLRWLHTVAPRCWFADVVTLRLIYVYVDLRCYGWFTFWVCYVYGCAVTFGYGYVVVYTVTLRLRLHFTFVCFPLRLRLPDTLICWCCYVVDFVVLRYRWFVTLVTLLLVTDLVGYVVVPVTFTFRCCCCCTLWTFTLFVTFTLPHVTHGGYVTVAGYLPLRFDLVWLHFVIYDSGYVPGWFPVTFRLHVWLRLVYVWAPVIFTLRLRLVLHFTRFTFTFVYVDLVTTFAFRTHGYTVTVVTFYRLRSTLRTFVVTLRLDVTLLPFVYVTLRSRLPRTRYVYVRLRLRLHVYVDLLVRFVTLPFTLVVTLLYVYRLRCYSYVVVVLRLGRWFTLVTDVWCCYDTFWTFTLLLHHIYVCWFTLVVRCCCYGYVGVVDLDLRCCCRYVAVTFTFGCYVYVRWCLRLLPVTYRCYRCYRYGSHCCCRFTLQFTHTVHAHVTHLVTVVVTLHVVVDSLLPLLLLHLRTTLRLRLSRLQHSHVTLRSLRLLIYVTFVDSVGLRCYVYTFVLILLTFIYLRCWLICCHTFTTFPVCQLFPTLPRSHVVTHGSSHVWFTFTFILRSVTFTFYHVLVTLVGWLPRLHVYGLFITVGWTTRSHTFGWLRTPLRLLHATRSLRYGWSVGLIYVCPFTFGWLRSRYVYTICTFISLRWIYVLRCYRSRCGLRLPHVYTFAVTFVTFTRLLRYVWRLHLTFVTVVTFTHTRLRLPFALRLRGSPYTIYHVYTHTRFTHVCPLRILLLPVWLFVVVVVTLRCTLRCSGCCYVWFVTFVTVDYHGYYVCSPLLRYVYTVICCYVVIRFYDLRYGRLPLIWLRPDLRWLLLITFTLFRFPLLIWLLVVGYVWFTLLFDSVGWFTPFAFVTFTLRWFGYVRLHGWLHVWLPVDRFTRLHTRLRSTFTFPTVTVLYTTRSRYVWLPIRLFTLFYVPLFTAVTVGRLRFTFTHHTTRLDVYVWFYGYGCLVYLYVYTLPGWLRSGCCYVTFDLFLRWVTLRWLFIYVTFTLFTFTDVVRLRFVLLLHYDFTGCWLLYGCPRFIYVWFTIYVTFGWFGCLRLHVYGLHTPLYSFTLIWLRLRLRLVTVVVVYVTFVCCVVTFTFTDFTFTFTFVICTRLDYPRWFGYVPHHVTHVVTLHVPTLICCLRLHLRLPVRLFPFGYVTFRSVYGYVTVTLLRLRLHTFVCYLRWLLIYLRCSRLRFTFTFPFTFTLVTLRLHLLRCWLVTILLFTFTLFDIYSTRLPRLVGSLQVTLVTLRTLLPVPTAHGYTVTTFYGSDSPHAALYTFAIYTLPPHTDFTVGSPPHRLRLVGYGLHTRYLHTVTHGCSLRLRLRLVRSVTFTFGYGWTTRSWFYVALIYGYISGYTHTRCTVTVTHSRLVRTTVRYTRLHHTHGYTFPVWLVWLFVHTRLRYLTFVTICGYTFDLLVGWLICYGYTFCSPRCLRCSRLLVTRLVYVHVYVTFTFDFTHHGHVYRLHVYGLRYVATHGWFGLRLRLFVAPTFTVYALFTFTFGYAFYTRCYTTDVDFTRYVDSDLVIWFTLFGWFVGWFRLRLVGCCYVYVVPVCYIYGCWFTLRWLLVPRWLLVVRLLLVTLYTFMRSHDFTLLPTLRYVDFTFRLRFTIYVAFVVVVVVTLVVGCRLFGYVVRCGGCWSVYGLRSHVVVTFTRLRLPRLVCSFVVVWLRLFVTGYTFTFAVWLRCYVWFVVTFDSRLRCRLRVCCSRSPVTGYRSTAVGPVTIPGCWFVRWILPLRLHALHTLPHRLPVVTVTVTCTVTFWPRVTYAFYHTFITVTVICRTLLPRLRCYGSRLILLPVVDLLITIYVCLVTLPHGLHYTLPRWFPLLPFRLRLRLRYVCLLRLFPVGVWPPVTVWFPFGYTLLRCWTFYTFTFVTLPHVYVGYVTLRCCCYTRSLPVVTLLFRFTFVPLRWRWFVDSLRCRYVCCCSTVTPRWWVIYVTLLIYPLLLLNSCCCCYVTGCCTLLLLLLLLLVLLLLLTLICYVVDLRCCWFVWLICWVLLLTLIWCYVVTVVVCYVVGYVWLRLDLRLLFPFIVVIVVVTLLLLPALRFWHVYVRLRLRWSFHHVRCSLRLLPFFVGWLRLRLIYVTVYTPDTRCVYGLHTRLRYVYVYVYVHIYILRLDCHGCRVRLPVTTFTFTFALHVYVPFTFVWRLFVSYARLHTTLRFTFTHVTFTHTRLRYCRLHVAGYRYGLHYVYTLHFGCGLRLRLPRLLRSRTTFAFTLPRLFGYRLRLRLVGYVYAVGYVTARFTVTDYVTRLGWLRLRSTFVCYGLPVTTRFVRYTFVTIYGWLRCLILVWLIYGSRTLVVRLDVTGCWFPHVYWLLPTPRLLLFTLPVVVGLRLRWLRLHGLRYTRLHYVRYGYVPVCLLHVCTRWFTFVTLVDFTHYVVCYVAVWFGWFTLLFDLVTIPTFVQLICYARLVTVVGRLFTLRRCYGDCCYVTVGYVCYVVDCCWLFVDCYDPRLRRCYVTLLDVDLFTFCCCCSRWLRLRSRCVYTLFRYVVCWFVTLLIWLLRCWFYVDYCCWFAVVDLLRFWFTFGRDWLRLPRCRYTRLPPVDWLLIWCDCWFTTIYHVCYDLLLLLRWFVCYVVIYRLRSHVPLVDYVTVVRCWTFDSRCCCWNFVVVVTFTLILLIYVPVYVVYVVVDLLWFDCCCYLRLVVPVVAILDVCWRWLILRWFIYSHVICCSVTLRFIYRSPIYYVVYRFPRTLHYDCWRYGTLRAIYDFTFICSGVVVVPVCGVPFTFPIYLRLLFVTLRCYVVTRCWWCDLTLTLLRYGYVWLRCCCWVRLLHVVERWLRLHIYTVTFIYGCYCRCYHTRLDVVRLRFGDVTVVTTDLPVYVTRCRFRCGWFTHYVVTRCYVVDYGYTFDSFDYGWFTFTLVDFTAFCYVIYGCPFIYVWLRLRWTFGRYVVPGYALLFPLGYVALLLLRFYVCLLPHRLLRFPLLRCWTFTRLVTLHVYTVGWTLLDYVYVTVTLRCYGYGCLLVDCTFTLLLYVTFTVTLWLICGYGWLRCWLFTTHVAFTFTVTTRWFGYAITHHVPTFTFVVTVVVVVTLIYVCYDLRLLRRLRYDLPRLRLRLVGWFTHVHVRYHARSRLRCLTPLLFPRTRLRYVTLIVTVTHVCYVTRLVALICCCPRLRLRLPPTFTHVWYVVVADFVVTFTLRLFTVGRCLRYGYVWFTFPFDLPTVTFVGYVAGYPHTFDVCYVVGRYWRSLHTFTVCCRSRYVTYTRSIHVPVTTRYDLRLRLHVTTRYVVRLLDLNVGLVTLRLFDSRLRLRYDLRWVTICYIPGYGCYFVDLPRCWMRYVTFTVTLPVTFTRFDYTALFLYTVGWLLRLLFRLPHADLRCPHTVVVPGCTVYTLHGYGCWFTHTFTFTFWFTFTTFGYVPVRWLPVTLPHGYVTLRCYTLVTPRWIYVTFATFAFVTFTFPFTVTFVICVVGWLRCYRLGYDTFGWLIYTRLVTVDLRSPFTLLRLLRWILRYGWFVTHTFTFTHTLCPILLRSRTFTVGLRSRLVTHTLRLRWLPLRLRYVYTFGLLRTFPATRYTTRLVTHATLLHTVTLLLVTLLRLVGYGLILRLVYTGYVYDFVHVTDLRLHLRLRYVLRLRCRTRYCCRLRFYVRLVTVTLHRLVTISRLRLHVPVCSVGYTLIYVVRLHTRLRCWFGLPLFPVTRCYVATRLRYTFTHGYVTLRCYVTFTFTIYVYGLRYVTICWFGYVGLLRLLRCYTLFDLRYDYVHVDFFPTPGCYRLLIARWVTFVVGRYVTFTIPGPGCWFTFTLRLIRLVVTLLRCSYTVVPGYVWWTGCSTRLRLHTALRLRYVDVTFTFWCVRLLLRCYGYDLLRLVPRLHTFTHTLRYVCCYVGCVYGWFPICWLRLVYRLVTFTRSVDLRFTLRTFTVYVPVYTRYVTFGFYTRCYGYVYVVTLRLVDSRLFTICVTFYLRYTFDSLLRCLRSFTLIYVTLFVYVCYVGRCYTFDVTFTFIHGTRLRTHVCWFTFTLFLHVYTRLHVVTFTLRLHVGWFTLLFTFDFTPHICSVDWLRSRLHLRLLLLLRLFVTTLLRCWFTRTLVIVGCWFVGVRCWLPLRYTRCYVVAPFDFVYTYVPVVVTLLIWFYTFWCWFVTLLIYDFTLHIYVPGYTFTLLRLRFDLLRFTLLIDWLIVVRTFTIPGCCCGYVCSVTFDFGRLRFYVYVTFTLHLPFTICRFRLRCCPHVCWYDLLRSFTLTFYPIYVCDLPPDTITVYTLHTHVYGYVTVDLRLPFDSVTDSLRWFTFVTHTFLYGYGWFTVYVPVPVCYTFTRFTFTRWFTLVVGLIAVTRCYVGVCCGYVVVDGYVTLLLRLRYTFTRLLRLHTRSRWFTFNTDLRLRLDTLFVVYDFVDLRYVYVYDLRSHTFTHVHLLLFTVGCYVTDLLLVIYVTLRYVTLRITFTLRCCSFTLLVIGVDLLVLPGRPTLTLLIYTPVCWRGFTVTIRLPVTFIYYMHVTFPVTTVYTFTLLHITFTLRTFGCTLLPTLFAFRLRYVWLHVGRYVPRSFVDYVVPLVTFTLRLLRYPGYVVGCYVTLLRLIWFGLPFGCCWFVTFTFVAVLIPRLVTFTRLRSPHTFWFGSSSRLHTFTDHGWRHVYGWLPRVYTLRLPVVDFTFPDVTFTVTLHTVPTPFTFDLHVCLRLLRLRLIWLQIPVVWLLPTFTFTLHVVTRYVALFPHVTLLRYVCYDFGLLRLFGYGYVHRLLRCYVAFTFTFVYDSTFGCCRFPLFTRLRLRFYGCGYICLRSRCWRCCWLNHVVTLLRWFTFYVGWLILPRCSILLRFWLLRCWFGRCWLPVGFTIYGYVVTFTVCWCWFGYVVTLPLIYVPDVDLSRLLPFVTFTTFTFTFTLRSCLILILFVAVVTFTLHVTVVTVVAHGCYVPFWFWRSLRLHTLHGPRYPTILRLVVDYVYDFDSIPVDLFPTFTVLLITVILLHVYFGTTLLVLFIPRRCYVGRWSVYVVTDIYVVTRCYVVYGYVTFVVTTVWIYSCGWLRCVTLLLLILRLDVTHVFVPVVPHIRLHVTLRLLVTLHIYVVDLLLRCYVTRWLITLLIVTYVWWFPLLFRWTLPRYVYVYVVTFTFVTLGYLRLTFVTVVGYVCCWLIYVTIWLLHTPHVDLIYGCWVVTFTLDHPLLRCCSHILRWFTFYVLLLDVTLVTFTLRLRLLRLPLLLICCLLFVTFVVVGYVVYVVTLRYVGLCHVVTVVCSHVDLLRCSLFVYRTLHTFTIYPLRSGSRFTFTVAVTFPTRCYRLPARLHVYGCVGLLRGLRFIRWFPRLPFTRLRLRLRSAATVVVLPHVARSFTGYVDLQFTGLLHTRSRWLVGCLRLRFVRCSLIWFTLFRWLPVVDLRLRWVG